MASDSLTPVPAWSTRELVHRRRRLLALGALALIACLATAPRAFATTLYAEQNGGATKGCPQGEPCSLPEAVKQAAAKDVVLLAPGVYGPAFSSQKITVSGEAGKARPLIKAQGADGAGLTLSAGGTVRHLRVEATPTVDGLVLGGGVLVEDVESVGAGAVACRFFGVTVRNTVCASANPIGVGLLLRQSGVSSLIVDNLVNVTAVGGENGIALQGVEGGSVTLVATNVIASGGPGEADITVLTDSKIQSAASIALSNSNFATVEKFGSSTSFTPPGSGTNQTAEPLFVSAAANNYREAAGSPTIAAGDISAVLPGETAAGGEPRTVACSNGIFVDIGAYQFPISCPAPPTAPKGPTVAPTAPKPPQLSNLSLKPSRFAVPGTPAPKGAARAAAVNYKLSAAAEVKLEVLAKVKRPGKKVRLVKKGQLTVQGKAGTNKLSFNGKLKGKPLAPGKYALRLTATADGLASKPLDAGFEIFTAVRID